MTLTKNKLRDVRSVSGIIPGAQRRGILATPKMTTVKFKNLLWSNS